MISNKKTKIKVSFHTLGCRLNQYDTEMMKERCLGWAKLEEPADIYIINTCAVTQRSEAKSRRFIRKAKGLVLVTGCYATVSPGEVLSIEGVDVVFDNSSKPQVLDIIKRALKGERGFIKLNGDDLNKEFISFDSIHTRAFVKIQDGCSRFCTFCKTVYARGAPRSKSAENIVSEVKRLVSNGYLEVVFSGVNLAEYPDLAKVLWEVSRIEGLKRIRLSSINPDGIDKELVNFFKESEKACPHLHIPLQSGDEGILLRMGRGYTTWEYREKIAYIRDNVADVTFGTDVLIGFPGEKRENFENTCDFIEEIGFSNIHIFRYSPRKDTKAAEFADQVSEREKWERYQKIKAKALEVTRAAKKRFIGAVVEVLVEEKDKEGLWRGYSKNYLDVHFPGKVKPGDIIQVEIKGLKEDHLFGLIIK
jgi:threonylcarbamoyladenosine tRNA methylthiotransferase MtaB